MALIYNYRKTKNGLRLGVLNVNGLGKKIKQEKIIDRMKCDQVDVFVLLDTRLDQNIKNTSTLPELQNAYICNKIDTHRGVLVATRPGLDIEITNPIFYKDGNMVKLDISSPEGEDFTLNAGYAPDDDTVQCFIDIANEFWLNIVIFLFLLFKHNAQDIWMTNVTKVV